MTHHNPYVRLTHWLLPVMALLALAMGGCKDFDPDVDNMQHQITSKPFLAVATYMPEGTSGYYFILDGSTVIRALNATERLFGADEQRCFVSYHEIGSSYDYVGASGANAGKINIIESHVNYVNSIYTKLPLEIDAAAADSLTSSSPLSIRWEWPTLIQDGYLTIYFNSDSGRVNLNGLRLLAGADADHPEVLVLHYDPEATPAVYDDTNPVIAFNLNGLDTLTDDSYLTLRWTSPDGPTDRQIALHLRGGSVSRGGESDISPWIFSSEQLSDLY